VGVTLVLLLLLVHLGDLQSFGSPYLMPLAAGKAPPLRPRLVTQKFRSLRLKPENLRNQR
jgi:hypothetical protein